MPRVLSEKHKAAMAAGRDKAKAERDKKRNRELSLLKKWSGEDARLTAEIIRREEEGEDASEFRAERVALCHELRVPLTLTDPEKED